MTTYTIEMTSKKNNIALLLLPILLILSACGPADHDAPSRYICLNDRWEEKTCDANEKAAIDGINEIITAIKKYKKEDLEERFYQRGEGDDDLYIFGENHGKADSQKETLGAINYLAQFGGKINLEGRDRHSGELRGKSCALVLLGMVYLTSEYAKLGKKYDPKERSDWVKATGFWKMMTNTSPSYPLDELNLSKLTCGYWDDKWALKGAKITRHTLTTRNQSLVTSSKENFPMPAKQKLMFLTGFAHMPMGEFLFAQKKNRGIPGFPGTLEDYYVMVAAQLKLMPGVRRFHLREESAGTTKDIFDYLKIQGNFREMIHKSLIK